MNPAPAPTPGGSRPVLPVRCGGYCYALPLEAVAEVAALVAAAPVPGANAALLGVANRGGAALPIVDLRRWLGMETATLNAQTLFVVVQDGDAQVGLVVDDVRPVRDYPAGQWQPVSGAGRWVSHSIADGDELVQVLHIPSLLQAAMHMEAGT